MAEISFKVQIEPDSDGYVSFECPFCGSDFRLKGDEFQCDDPLYTEMYCPYCGLSDSPSKFYTKEVMEQINAIAMNYMNEELKKAFSKMSRQINKSKFLKMTYKPMKNLNVKDLKTEDSVEEIFECKSCNNHVKVLSCAGNSKVFCSYCGNDI
ncbi:MAG: hypothetical protein PHR25_05280 [Clostridia bacterium]|nr:hypothetical protein [Clostridia bacterium]